MTTETAFSSQGLASGDPVKGEDAPAGFDDAALQKKAKDHLWMHFTRQSVMDSGAGVPIITRGEGHHIWDSTGR